MPVITVTYSYTQEALRVVRSRQAYIVTWLVAMIMMPPHVFASTERETAPAQSSKVIDLRSDIDLANLFVSRFSVYRTITPDPLDALTFGSYNPSVVRYEFRGPLRPLVRYTKRKLRSLIQDYIQTQAAFLPPSVENRMHQRHQDAWDDLENGRWWERTWFDSLLPSEGGKDSHTIIYGSDVRWRLGPVRISNSLKFDFEHAAFLELNTDPTPESRLQQFPVNESMDPIAVDVDSPERSYLGASVNFKVKPNLRVGIPLRGNWEEVFKNVAVRASTTLGPKGKSPWVHIEASVGYRPPTESVFATLDIALLGW